MIQKFTLLAYLMVSATSAVSQTSADSLQLDVNKVVQPLNKSQVPFGMLEEYGLGLIPLDVFNGTLTDSTVADLKTWRGLYASLYTSRIYGTNPMATLQTVNTTLKSEAQAAGAVIPVALMDYNYAAFRPDAISAGLITAQNGQLFDVPNRPQIPYIQKNCFAAAPVKSWSDGQPSLLFKQNLYYSNRGKTISTIKVNFGDGAGLRTVSFGTPLTASYINSGAYKIVVQVVYNDNSVMQCYANMEVTNINSTARYNPFPDNFQQFFATANHNGGRALIAFSQGNTTSQLRKPLIVVEGYDISSIAPGLQDNYTYRHFIAAINAPAPTYDFNDQLDMADYDIVFLDFNDGTDDIIRNARLLQEVITWVNGQKAMAGSTEQNVVLGLSMGGLVARYALANMTKQSIATGTRLLITHDSPHRGANLPVGMQHLITILNTASFLPGGIELTDIIEELEQARAVAEAPATQQLLLLRSTSTTVLPGMFTYEIATNTFLNNAYRNMITFPSSGPQPVYNVIATSMGSQCGNAVLSPSTKIVDMRGKLRLSAWIFRANYYLDLEAWALNNTNSNSQITHLKFSTNKTLLVLPISRTIYEATISANTVGNSYQAWDIVPGGTQNTVSQLGAIPTTVPDVEFEYSGILARVSTEINIAPGVNFCFVPTVSALDVATINQSSLYGRYINGFTSYTSRMGNFVAQEQFTNNGVQQFNQEHILFTPRNAQWMFNEMEGITNALGCSSECTVDNNATISGPNQFCTAADYQLNGSIATNAALAWSTPDGFVSFSPSGTSVEVTLDPGQPGGDMTLVASLNGTCGSTVLATKSISVGMPYLITNVEFSSNGLGGGSTLCNHPYDFDDYANTFQVTLNSPPVGQSLTLHYSVRDMYTSALMAQGTIYNFSETNAYSLPPSLPVGMYNFEGQVTGSCGIPSEWYEGSLEYADCSPSRSFNITVFPNPVSDNLNVRIGGEAKSTAIDKNEKIVFELFDLKQTRLIRSWRAADDVNLHQLGIHGIKSGHYILVVTKGKTKQAKHVIIE